MNALAALVAGALRPASSALAAEAALIGHVGAKQEVRPASVVGEVKDLSGKGAAAAVGRPTRAAAVIRSKT